MKKITFILFMLVASISTSFGQTSYLVLEKETYDLGFINERGGIVTLRVPVYNRGTSPILLEYVTSTCFWICTNWTKEPINQNERAMIVLTYNPLGRPGKFHKKIRIHTNENIDVDFFVKGEVLPNITESNGIGYRY